MEKISMGALPPSVKRIAVIFADIVETYACKDPAELFKVQQNTPLEIFLVAQTDKNDKVEKHFIVGLAVPCKTDKFDKPLLYMAPMTYEQFIKYEEILKNKMKVKDINRKSNLWLPNA